MKSELNRKLLVFVLFAIALFWPGHADANIGVPFVAYVLTVYWLLLITVIVVEAVVLARRFSLGSIMAIEVSIVANLVSAFLGSVVIIVFEIVFAKAGFEAYYGWLAKIPFYVALPPTYFLTVWLEALIALPIIRTKTYRNLVRDFYVVNIYSYAVLAIAGLLITQGPY